MGRRGVTTRTQSYTYIHILALKKIYASKADIRRNQTQIEYTRSHQGDSRRQGVTQGKELVSPQSYEGRGDTVLVQHWEKSDSDCQEVQHTALYGHPSTS
eukprot:TRINITY_DN7570_c0_g1_i1.p2 TRINITY_DN7570_c0_g1~~TRINITY_DN7570_c0_g1_i1.p2  ORF type:complete len:100 (+),score=1.23 TRINITY_DN7570_c0_g1_i1:191-490(+)